MQWDSLESYFLSNFDLDDDPSENNPNEKSSREKRMVNAFKQPVCKLYAMFIWSVIPIFDYFFNWDSVHAKMNKHYKAWSYKKKKHKKIKAYRKSL